MTDRPSAEHESHLDNWLRTQVSALHDALDSVLDIDAGLADTRIRTQIVDSLNPTLDTLLDVDAGLRAIMPSDSRGPQPQRPRRTPDDVTAAWRAAPQSAARASLRLGPLIRLMAGAAVLAVLICGVLLAASRPNEHGRPPTEPTGPISVAARIPALAFHVARTQGNGLNMRSCPTVDCARVGWIADGGTFTATCSILGAPVNGDRTWLRGTAAGQPGYVSDYYLDPTTVTMPACGSSQ